MGDGLELSECADCGGLTEPTHTTVDERWGDELFVFEDVPARVCRACGEVYLSAEVTRRLEAERQTKAHTRRRVSVPARRSWSASPHFRHITSPTRPTPANPTTSIRSSSG